MKKMKASDSLIEKVKEFEGLSLEAYQCSSDVWTIGYGHTRNVQRGDRIIIEMANDYLAEDLGYSTRMLAKHVTRELTQGQADALIDFIFNCGIGNFAKSTLLKYVNEGRSDEEVCNQIRRWVYSKGEVSRGLQKRREAECQMWMSH